MITAGLCSSEGGLESKEGIRRGRQDGIFTVGILRRIALLRTSSGPANQSVSQPRSARGPGPPELSASVPRGAAGWFPVALTLSALMLFKQLRS